MAERNLEWKLKTKKIELDFDRMIEEYRKESMNVDGREDFKKIISKYEKEIVNIFGQENLETKLNRMKDYAIEGLEQTRKDEVEEGNLERRINESEKEIIARLKEIRKNELMHPRINPMPLSTKKLLTFKDYVEICNSYGLVLATCADFYNISKYKERSKINSIPKEVEFDDYNKRYLNGGEGIILTGDVIQYPYSAKNNASSKLIRNHLSEIKKPAENNIVIPKYSSELKDSLNNIVGLKFLQILFNTEDKPQEIYNNLMNIFNPKPSNIYLDISSPSNSLLNSPVYFHARKHGDFLEIVADSSILQTGRAYCLNEADFHK